MCEFQEQMRSDASFSEQVSRDQIGDKGEVVIRKELREQLGIEPGWIALQRVVDNRIEIQFIPPEHNKSLKGSLAK